MSIKCIMSENAPTHFNFFLTNITDYHPITHISIIAQIAPYFKFLSSAENRNIKPTFALNRAVWLISLIYHLNLLIDLLKYEMPHLFHVKNLKVIAGLFCLSLVLNIL